MDIEQYKMFITVADCGSISEAARMLNITQPALSTKMKRLAEECGAVLLERKGNLGVVLTDEGRIVYRKAQNICRLEHELMKELRECDDALRGTVHVQIFPWESESMVSHIMKNFSVLYPNVKYSLSYMSMEGGNKHLAEYDLRILSRDEMGEYCETKDILVYKKCSIYAVVAKDSDYFTDRKCIGLKDLSELPLILPNCSWMRKMVKYMAANRYDVNLFCRTFDRRGTLSMAAANLGVGLLAMNDDAKANPDLRYIEIVDDGLYYTVVIAKDKFRDLSNVTKGFLRYCINLKMADGYIETPLINEIL